MSRPGDASDGGIAVGIRARDGAVLAADRRASDGSLVTGEARKVAAVHPTAAVAAPTMDGAAQSFVRSLRSEASGYENRHEGPMSVSALATRAGTLAREHDLGHAVVLGGADDEGPRVVEVDPDGGVLTDDWVAAGAGRELAAGALEGVAEPDPALEDAVRRAVAAVEAAAERAATAGDGATVARVTADGVDIEDEDTDHDR